MQQAGVCAICEKADTAIQTCNICGITVCSSCFKHNLGCCSRCAVRFEQY
ncbi:MAG: orotate phosphoribosyltransferase [Nanoarchaeota archaeon]|nr:orotate phosphoribosyltransferase [Nanoarchaeota archaeon]